MAARFSPTPTGASMSLKVLGADNSVGTNWCESTTPFGDGDLGTPGAPNTCDLAPPTPAGQPLPLIENFDSCALAGWQIISVDSDTANTWSCSETFSNTEANGFGNAAAADEWLITPPLDLDAQESDSLEFRNYTRFSDAGFTYPQLSVLYSTDYDGSGDPTSATWTPLTGINFSPENSNAWVDSGSIDLSGIAGDSVYFAFRYQSSGTSGGSAANWRLDAISFAVALPPEPPKELAIHEIQGSGDTSPEEGNTVTTTGIVIGDFQGVPLSTQFHPEQLSGFFIQEPDVDSDGNTATSEGIFVFCGSCATDVNVGDAVTVTGEVSEFFGKTQISVTGGSVVVTSSGNTLPTPALIVFGLDQFDELEQYEGMLVTFSDTLTVTEYFQLGRFGQVVLYAGDPAGDRPFQFTHDSAPDVAGLAAFQDELAGRQIVLDDDAFGDNEALDNALNVFHPIPGLSTDNFFRGGDTIDGLTGVLDFAAPNSTSDGTYRVRPVVGEFDYSFTAVNPRSEAPDDVGGTLKVVSANVLNFFPTIDVTSSSSSGDCGPSGTLDCRGADSEAELERQTEKLVAALCAIDGDIVGLSEIENDASGSASLTTLVDALNDADTGCGTSYSFVDAGVLGTDAIKVGMLYRTDTVSPVGDFFIVDNDVDPDYNDDKNRPTLIQVFEELATDERVIIAAHHLKSKGSDCAGVTFSDGTFEDETIEDGQGNCSDTRARAAGIVADFISDVVIPGNDDLGVNPAGTDLVLAIGDLNAYKKEDAVVEFTSRGYIDLIESFNGDEAYSFVFDAKLGYLDHALGLNIEEFVTGVTEWHINADEINLFDYNDDVRDVGERSFDEEPLSTDALELYDRGPFRSSDHDPVIGVYAKPRKRPCCLHCEYPKIESRRPTSGP
jgi:predicted extracellular nuclease